MSLLPFVVSALLLQQTAWSEVEKLLDPDDDVRKTALRTLKESGELGLLAGLNDVLYFHYVQENRRRTGKDQNKAEEVADLMESIGGEAAGENPRTAWAEWIGRHDEIEPLAGYLRFKRSVFMRYDPAFRGYFNPRFRFRIRVEEIEWGGVRKDGIPALDQPGFIDAADDTFLTPDDRVFGVYLNGVAKAYPHRILDPHEMCNDIVGGIPVSLSYCTLCGSGILYRGDHASRDGKKPFTFGSSGLLYRSNKLMYDRPTNSLWNNLTGQPVSGRLAESGIELDKLPLVVSTWAAWRERHPDTLVVDVSNTGFPNRDYTKSPYESYFASDKTMFPVWLRSDALQTKQIVFALIVNGLPKAYPLDVLKRERLTHDELRGKAVVLLTDAESGAVRAYESGDYRFELGPDGSVSESGTGDRWNVEEDHLSSPAGEKLDRIAGHNAFWFGWYAFFPTTEVYRGSEP